LSPVRRDAEAPTPNNLPGSCSPSRHEYMKSTSCRASQGPTSFALNVSHALGDLLLHIPCGLISSHSHVRDSHFRGFPRCQAGSPHRRVVPSCRSRKSPTGELPHWRRIVPRRLQGVDPSSDPLRLTGGLDLPTTRSPLCFQLLRAFVQTPWRCLHIPSAHDLLYKTLAVPLALGLQRINRCSA